MKLIFATAYVILFFEVFLVSIKILHYQKKKKRLDKLTYELMSNLELTRQLCKVAGYDIKEQTHFLVFPNNITEMVKEINRIMQHINTKDKKVYKQNFLQLYSRAKERHVMLLNEYNTTCNKINYILDKWPKPFKGSRPTFETPLDEELRFY